MQSMDGRIAAFLLRDPARHAFTPVRQLHRYG
jgi:hypothetical protein